MNIGINKNRIDVGMLSLFNLGYKTISYGSIGQLENQYQQMKKSELEGVLYFKMATTRIGNSGNNTNIAEPEFTPFNTGKSGVKYSPINQGPLKQGIAETFTGASYSQKTLEANKVFYRVSTNEAGKVGSYMTRTPQMGGMQSQLDLALNPEWGNTAQVITKVTVPKGTVIYEGTAAPQVINGGAGMLPGGGNQIYIPEVNPKWFK